MQRMTWTWTEEEEVDNFEGAAGKAAVPSRKGRRTCHHSVTIFYREQELGGGGEVV